MSTASHRTSRPLAGIPSRSPAWVAVTTSRNATRSPLAMTSCSSALMFDRAPMKAPSSPTMLSTPATSAMDGPCQRASAVKKSRARSGSCPLKTSAMNLRGTSIRWSIVSVWLMPLPLLLVGRVGRALGDRRSPRGVIESWKAVVRAPASSDRSVAATEGKGAAIVPVMVTRQVELRLLGRDRERQVLERLLEGVLAGHGGVLVLHGEPGVGKTALLEFA